MSYFGYKRGDKPRVNWGGLAEKFSQDLLAEKASRDQRKKAIADAQAKELAELDKQAVTPKTSVNSEIIRSSNDARQAYLTNVRLMRRGLIKPSAARAGQQRLADGYKMYNQYMTTWGEKYKEFVTDRTNGSELDDEIQQDHFKFGNVEQWGLVVDPNNMNLLMGLKDKDGNVDMSKTVDMANILNTNQDFHDEFDAVTYYNNLGDKIVGTIEKMEQSTLGNSDFLKVFQDYYEVGDITEYMKAVEAAQESGDFSAIADMNRDLADANGLTTFGMAHYNLFQTIDAGLGAVNDRDRASALEQIGYNLVNVSDEVDLETLQSDSKYNKEGSKDIYVYRDEQGLLQPYLSESQNNDFRRDGLYRSVAAKDFKIETIKTIRDPSGNGNNESSKDFAPAPWMNVIKARFPGKLESFRAATSVIAAATNVNAGTITLDSDGNINGLGGTSPTDRTGVPKSNEEWLSMSTREKNEAIDVLMGMDVNDYIGTTQANMPQASGEYEDMRRAITNGVENKSINFSTTASYRNTLAELEELNYSIYSAENLLSKSGIYNLAQNFKNADTNKKMNTLMDDAQDSLRKVSKEVGNLSKNMSISQAGRNQARDLQREIDNFISSITLNTKDMEYDFAGEIGGNMVYGTIYGGAKADEKSQEQQFEFSSFFEQIESIINNIK